MSDMVLRSDTDGIATLTLNDPDTLNSLSDAMLAALSRALADIAESDARVVILRAEGKAFCAGHNLREMQAMRQAEDGGAARFADLFDRCAAVMAQITQLPQPVIAQVHALATAAGCQLVATCDMAVAAESARFGVNGVNIGLFCSTPMVALTRNIPRKHAMEMLTTGTFIDAARAAGLGLVNRAVPDGALEEETHALAATVASKLSRAVRIGKGAFHAQADLPVAEAYALARDAMVANLSEADTAEGIQTFLEKRAPGWTQ
ncbi:enoyl-CoA hydratase [Jannaschia rubra]|uniref:Enoyl-CoA hydratase domain-containing protein 3, mitochondrial n=1 Tax=Jannaschia rubra TaxID=282197 RepID=A0A0M6XSZ8_9RHOB|nr:enoyl-CoA hydratase [Jannaschia rubra]CTQ34316.1 putative enoyl-CoA hydratase echA8 [Jannaschia rubra]SFG18077.1 Enoyl-CoA hydratase/carnithine racemase [Jannaschia rubra]